MKAIENACEEFRVITYTVHGDDEKARISIMFSNIECKQVKRKSVATVRRDSKRMKEFNDSKSTASVTADCDRPVSNTDVEVLNENTNVKTVDSDSNNNEPNMEFESVPVCASSLFTEVKTVGENIEHSIDSTVDSNEPVKQVTTTSVEVNKQKETGLKDKQKVLNSKSANSEQCDINKLEAQWKDVVFEKIVLKKSRMEADRLIGKCSNGRLITYNIHQKVFDIGIYSVSRRTLRMFERQCFIHMKWRNMSKR